MGRCRSSFECQAAHPISPWRREADKHRTMRAQVRSCKDCYFGVCNAAKGRSGVLHAVESDISSPRSLRRDSDVAKLDVAHRRREIGFSLDGGFPSQSSGHLQKSNDAPSVVCFELRSATLRLVRMEWSSPHVQWESLTVEVTSRLHNDRIMSSKLGTLSVRPR